MFAVTPVNRISHEVWIEIWERWKKRVDSTQTKVLGNYAPSVTGDLIAPENLTAPVPAPTYLDKTFVQPAYICQNGRVDIALVDKTIEEVPARVGQLLEHEPSEKPLDLDKPAPLGDAIEAKKAELKAEVEVPQDAPTMQSAVMPLFSDVWNAVEPLNYVSSFLHSCSDTELMFDSMPKSKSALTRCHFMWTLIQAARCFGCRPKLGVKTVVLTIRVCIHQRSLPQRRTYKASGKCPTATVQGFYVSFSMTPSVLAAWLLSSNCWVLHQKKTFGTRIEAKSRTVC